MSAKQVGSMYDDDYKKGAESDVTAQTTPSFEEVFGRTRDELIDLIRKLEKEADENATTGIV